MVNFRCISSAVLVSEDPGNAPLLPSLEAQISSLSLHLDTCREAISSVEVSKLPRPQVRLGFLASQYFKHILCRHLILPDFCLIPKASSWRCSCPCLTSPNALSNLPLLLQTARPCLLPCPPCSRDWARTSMWKTVGLI